MEMPVMTFAVALTHYRRWFAWYPIRTWDLRWRWLCWVERRTLGKKPDLPGPIGTPWFQHRVVEATPQKLWLWRDGEGRFLAFNDLFPTMPDCADPAVIGQPCGYAIFHPMTLAEAQRVSHEVQAAKKQDRAAA